MAAQLEVKWQTETLPNNGWVARQDVPPQLAEEVGKVLVELNDTAEGRAMVNRLGISRFERASDETYASVRRYLEKFSATVRHVEF